MTAPTNQKQRRVDILLLSMLLVAGFAVGMVSHPYLVKPKDDYEVRAYIDSLHRERLNQEKILIADDSLKRASAVREAVHKQKYDSATAVHKKELLRAQKRAREFDGMNQTQLQATIHEEYEKYRADSIAAVQLN